VKQGLDHVSSLRFRFSGPCPDQRASRSGGDRFGQAKGMRTVAPGALSQALRVACTGSEPDPFFLPADAPTYQAALPAEAGGKFLGTEQLLAGGGFGGRVSALSLGAPSSEEWRVRHWAAEHKGGDKDACAQPKLGTGGSLGGIYFSAWGVEGSRDRRSAPGATACDTTAGGVVPGRVL
jgi:hypothetical protein